MASVVLIQFLIYWQSWLNVIFLGENLLILVTSWWLPSIKFTTAIHPKTWEHRRWCSLYSWLLSLATVPVQPRRTRKGAFSFDNSTYALVGDTGGTFFHILIIMKSAAQKATCCNHGIRSFPPDPPTQLPEERLFVSSKKSSVWYVFSWSFVITFNFRSMSTPSSPPIVFLLALAVASWKHQDALTTSGGSQYDARHKSTVSNEKAHLAWHSAMHAICRRNCNGAWKKTASVMKGVDRG